jgi:hypothetical protein
MNELTITLIEADGEERVRHRAFDNGDGAISVSSV